MKNIARILFMVLAVMPIFSMTSCSRYEAGSGTEGEKSKKLKVVTTLFPYYDFARQIAGDRIDLDMVVPAGMDSHSFEPTPADIIMLQSADILICNGGVMELWLSKVLQSVDTSHMTVITMMDYVDVVEEETVEGMEAEEHGRRYGEEAHGHEEDDGHEVEIEYDEHIWTSPRNAIIISGVIGETLEKKDPLHGEYYKKQTQEYQDQLEALTQEIWDVVGKADRKLMVFGDKFPFRYFSEEFGLSYRAAFTGCSSDTEPSAKTIAYLIDKVRQDQIPAVYYLELSSHRVAEIIGEETGASPLLFHSCHNVTRGEFDSGITYLELMKRNVENLRKGLQS